MRVALFSSIITAEHGGRYTFKETILSEIDRRISHGMLGGHEVILFTREDLRRDEHAHIPRIVIREESFREGVWRGVRSLSYTVIRQAFQRRLAMRKLPRLLRVNALNEQSAAHNIDLIWFLGGFEPTNVPYVFTLFDLQHRIQPELLTDESEKWTLQDREAHFELALPNARKIITGTATGKEELLEHYKIREERIEIIPMPVKAPVQYPAEQSNAEQNSFIPTTPYLFYPAGYWEHKNHLTLFRALRRLKESHGIELRLICCGGEMGYRAQLERMVCENGVSAQVELRSFVSDLELAQLYHHAVALVFPTLFGPDNLPPLEAFTYRCPVIASEVSGAREQLGEAALLFPPTNDQQLAAIIARLVTEKDLRTTLIERGTARLKGRTAADYVDAMVRTIGSLEGSLK